MNYIASHLSYSIGGKQILNDVSLKLTSGLFTAIVGPNGAGKSTLLKIASGELKTTHGNVTLLEKPLNQYSSQELSSIRSVLSQQVNVSFPFSVREVVALGLDLQWLRQVEKEEIVREVLKETGIFHLMERLYPTLSGGEKQRVQLARAMAQIWTKNDKPRFLLLDEPTNNLDLAHQHDILSTARNMLNNNVGVLAVIHDLNLAAQYADQIVFMKDGEVYLVGTPEEVMHKEIIEEVFNHPVIVYHSDQGPFVMPIPNSSKHSFLSTLNNIPHEQFNYQ